MNADKSKGRMGFDSGSAVIAAATHTPCFYRRSSAFIGGSNLQRRNFAPT
jgi:hypothetical protein